MQVLDAVPGDEATWPLQCTGFQVEISCFDSFWSLKHCSSAQPDLTCRLAIRMLTKTIDLQPAIFVPTSLSSHLIIPTPRSSLPPRPAPAPRQPSPICCKHISWKSGLDLNYVYESVRQKFRPGGIWFQMFWHVLPFKHKPQLQEGISPLRGMECYGRWCGQANLNLNLSTLHCQPLIFLHGWWGGWGGMENGRPWRVSVGSRVIVRKHWWNLKQVFTFVIQQDWPSWKYSFENICWCLKMVRQHIKKNRDRLSQQEKQHNGKCCAMKCWEKGTQNVLHF